MDARISRLWSLPIHVALAFAMVLAAASFGFAAPRAQAQELAIPPCAEVFELGEATLSCLRVVNAASLDVGPVDVYVGDAPVVEGLEYGQATEFTAIPSEAQQLRVVQAGAAVEDAIVDFTEELQPGGAYQLTTLGLTAEELSSWLSGVDVSPLPAGVARVRVVHASPDLGPIDVALADGAVPFEGIELGTQSGYVEIEAMEATFQVRQAGEDTLLLTNPEPVQLEEGMIYDLYVIGESEEGTLEFAIFTAEVGIVGDATPAANVTPIVAVGGTPISVTPGAESPVPDPEEGEDAVTDENEEAGAGTTDVTADFGDDGVLDANDEGFLREDINDDDVFEVGIDEDASGTLDENEVLGEDLNEDEVLTEDELAN